MASFPSSVLRWIRTVSLIGTATGTGIPFLHAADERASLLELKPVTQEEQAAAWEISGEPWDRKGPAPEYNLENDDVLGRPVVVLSGRWMFRSKHPSGAGAYVVEGLIRFPERVPLRDGRTLSTGLLVSCGERLVGSDPVPAYTFHMKTFGNLFFGSARMGEAQPSLRPSVLKPDEWGGDLMLKPGIDAASISPILPESIRLEMESALASMPKDSSERWHSLRIEVGTSRIRMFVNGALVCDRSPPEGVSAEGPVIVRINGRAKLGGLSVRRLEENRPGYSTVPLDYRCNRESIVDFAAHQGVDCGRITLDSIPFDLPQNIDGKNQVDVGASLYRHRLGTSYTADYDPRETVPGPDSFDPDRITLRVPSRAWRRAWILAASDGAPNRIPLVTLRFYKPFTNWTIDAVATVPEMTFQGDAGNARPVEARAKDGSPVRLWLIPVDWDTAALAADYPMQAIEITKSVLPNVGYPDPCNYAYFQGGLPSSVQLFGLTLEEAPLHAVGTGSNNGNVFEGTEKPDWIVTVRNQTDQEQKAKITVAVTGPYGETWSDTKEMRIAASATERIVFHPESKTFGLYRVETRVECGDWRQSREGTFLVLPANERKETPETSPWGLWSWVGTHATLSDPDDCARLLKAFGAINNFKLFDEKTVDKQRVRENLYEFRKKWGIGASNYRAIPRNVPDWSKKNPIDPDEFQKYADEVGKTVAGLKQENPDLESANAFAENAVSLRLTHGVPPWAFGEPWFEYDKAEKERLHSLWEAAKAGAVGIRDHAPGVKFLLGHCAPNFFTPFFMLEDWEKYKDRIDGFGLDMPQFERMPERQPRATEPSLLYFLKKEMKERGLIEKELVHLESYFPPSHPLALGLQGQAENIVRTAVLSLALGTTKFEDAWGLDDCGDRWGSQHYGCPGLIGRPPESNPKPAAAAFATMTRVLDLCRYEAWLPTGSRSAFCLRFKGPDRNVYAVWTIHGTRPMEIVPESDSVKLVRIDSQGNEFPLPLKDGVATVALSPAAEWVVALGGGVREARAGKPTYSDAPGEHRVLLENFETGEWRQDGEPHKAFEANHWDVVRKRVPMNVRRVADPERGSTTLEVVLENPDETRPLTGFYAGLVPEAPIPIPGKAKAIGVYGKGISAWSRIVFEVEDAGGERWMSCGLKDAWNSDDIHSRTYLNHDGWRYMEIPLPANAPGDNYRESSTVGWGYDRDGIVDLPLKLVRAFVAMRSKMIYIDELLPVDGTALRLDEIQAVYESPEAMTEKPVEAQKMAANVLVRSRDVAALPNPIAELGAESSGRAAVIEKVYPPEVMQSGDSIYVRIKPVENAKEYRVYVSAYSDGTGAQVMGKPDKEPNVIYIRKLQPSIPIHLFATWIDLDGKESKPSEGRKTILKDEFPFK